MSYNFIENEKLSETANVIDNDNENSETLTNKIENLENGDAKEILENFQNAEVKVEPESKTENDIISTSAELESGDNKRDNKDEWTDLLGSGAIMRKILREGRPDTRPERTEKCTINYTCYLEDETIVDSVTNFELYLGESDVIQGLDVALGLMNVDEQCRLKIEPRLAFGKIGLPPKIPGNTTVIYDVELLSVHPEDDIETFTIQQRKILGNKKRERGNWWYTRGENNIAIQCYRRALDYLDEVEGGISGPLSEDGTKQQVSDTDLQGLLEDRISVCNNMAAAQIKMELYEPALKSLQIVLRCQPDNVKAHFRKAKVYIGKNDLPTAMKCLQKAKELAPNDKDIQKQINSISILLEKQKASERELARRMFNGPKKLDEKSDLRKKSSKNKLGIWTTVGAVVAVGVAGFMAYRFKYV